TVLLTVADLSEMEAVVEVDETDVPEISLGDSANLEIDAFPDRIFTGRVTKIANSSIQGATAGLSGRSTDQSV
ncbi:MAG: HlyD family efflux transporter periplasmic adaptor subunit, partial [Gammaproteobacteria bacterium]|nr:HlyD family efflux transporter periplasmic adaptor subunit [Gammaproteobacteria bacterium]